MAEHKITEFLYSYFQEFLKKPTVFKNKRVLDDSYIPENVKYREKEIMEISYHLAPLLKKDKASNILLFGPPGTGKTLCAKFVSNQMTNFSIINKIPFKAVYVNCRMGRSTNMDYFVMKEIIQQLTGKNIPNGTKFSDLYNQFVEFLKKDISILIILDEIDKLVKYSREDLIYLLTRENHIAQKDNLAFIGISNNLSYLDSLDERVLSSLGAVKIMFKVYDANQLFDILKDRAILAFKEGAIGDEVLRYISAYIAKESGDARKAIHILRISGEIADKKGKSRVTIEDAQEAIELYDLDDFLSLCLGLTVHEKLILLAILQKQLEAGFAPLNQVYDIYVNLCEEYGYKPLSKKTVFDRVKRFEMMFEGYIETQTIYNKNYRIKLVKILLENKKIAEIINRLKESLNG